MIEINKIHCGDNCELMMQLPKECIDLVVTSPPYDDLRTYGGHSWDFFGVAWNLQRVLKPGGVIVWVVADSNKNHCESLTSFRQAITFTDNGLNLVDTMIYRKNGQEFPRKNHRVYPQVWEYMFVFAKGSPSTFNMIRDKPNVTSGSFHRCIKSIRNKDGYLKPSSTKNHVIPEIGARGNLWEYATGGSHSSKDAIAYDHPAIFPEALARDHIYSWSNPGDLVLDPFAGSGTTCKAAKALGRNYIGLEINPAYCAIADRRLAQEILGIDAV